MSNYFIIILVLIIICYGILKKIDIYEAFILGSKEGLNLGIKIFPCLIIMILAINVFLKSGLMDFIIGLFKPLFEFIRFPSSLVPLALLRPISGSSSLVLLNEIFIKYGTDSFVGRLASVIQGSTDTTIYIISLYFGSIGIKKIRYALKVGLITDLITIILSFIICLLLF